MEGNTWMGTNCEYDIQTNILKRDLGVLVLLLGRSSRMKLYVARRKILVGIVKNAGWYGVWRSGCVEFRYEEIDSSKNSL